MFMPRQNFFCLGVNMKLIVYQYAFFWNNIPEANTDKSIITLTCHLEETSKHIYNIFVQSRLSYLDCLPYSKSFLTFHLTLCLCDSLWTSWLRTSVYWEVIATSKISIMIM